MKTLIVLTLTVMCSAAGAAEAKAPRNYTPVVIAKGKPIVVAQRRCTTTCTPNPYTCTTHCY